MDGKLLFIGMAVGVAVAAPVGPVGVLCMRTSIRSGFRAGLLTGLGAAVADGLFASIAAFGLATLSGFLLDHRSVLTIIGGVFLLGIGVKIFLDKPKDLEEKPVRKRGIAYSASTAFVLTVSNPATILGITAIFAALGVLTDDLNYANASLLVAGVFLGSILLWIVLSAVAKNLLSRFSDRVLLWSNRTFGILIFLFGLVALFHGIFPKELPPG